MNGIQSINKNQVKIREKSNYGGDTHYVCKAECKYGLVTTDRTKSVLTSCCVTLKDCNRLLLPDIYCSSFNTSIFTECGPLTSCVTTKK